MEVWKDIIGYNGDYQISSLGRVKFLRINPNYLPRIKDKFLKTTPNKIGYPRVRLSLNDKIKYYTIHRLLAIHFIPNPDSKPFINHINGIKTDNRLENLEWCTQSENMQHAYKYGLNHKGEKHGSSKLTEKQVLEIRELLRQKEKQVDIAKIYNITHSNVFAIKKNKTWKHI